jgi:hypothetical protein
MTRETVCVDTPQWAATSLIVIRWLDPNITNFSLELLSFDLD